MRDSPEIGKSIAAAGVRTNYHDMGAGSPVVMIHGSGPGVSAWANWRLALPELAKERRVLAPDMAGFGYSDGSKDGTYSLDRWVKQAIGFLDALNIEQADLVGNSFGGAISLALAIRHPERVRRLVLMGAAGLKFELTPALDAVWGYTPSVQNMKEIMGTFAYDASLLTDGLALMRYEASIRPGVQEAYAAMFPAPRQRWVDALASPEDRIAGLSHQTLVIHGREDRVLPLATSLRLAQLIPRAQLHVFGQCGHWTQIEHASRFVRLVGDFLAEADAAA
ncbi:alpha/beta fold hydrolase [Ramlibacter sp. PS3R-8]|uniref:alpha/beta fold hydrolase n=1 Tax=Ramlibacter sp. PS3R-8 TaxID=3133437 RepID=UPI0030A59172